MKNLLCCFVLLTAVVTSAATFEIKIENSSKTGWVKKGEQVQVKATVLLDGKPIPPGYVLRVSHWTDGKPAKGSSVAAAKIENFTITMDVDAVLNNTHPDVTPKNAMNNVNMNVTGITDLVLNGVDISGAKSIMNSFGLYQEHGHLWVDGVDMTLDISQAVKTDVLGNDDSGNAATFVDNLYNTNGEIKQIAGAGTAETDDDVWASLNQVDNDLVVAWGRTEEEVGAALDAFKADNTLTLGDAVVGNATTLGDADASNDFEKKNNGTLA